MEEKLRGAKGAVSMALNDLGDFGSDIMIKESQQLQRRYPTHELATKMTEFCNKLDIPLKGLESEVCRIQDMHQRCCA